MLADLEDGTRDLWHEVNNSMAYALSKPIRPDQNKAPRQNVLYVQEVVTLQKKYLIYLHQTMRFTPFINYYDTIIILGHMNSIGSLLPGHTVVFM